MKLRDIDDRRASSLVEAVNEAYNLYNITLTDESFSVVKQSNLSLKTHLEEVKARNQYKTFAADLHSSERATSHFFRPPQQDCLQSPITCFQAQDGSVTEDQAQISTGRRHFWGQLFQSPSPDLYDQCTATCQPLRLVEFLQDTTACLTMDQISWMDAPLTANEFCWAIMTSKSGKAPGPDGLPIEYYKMAINEWARIFEVVHDNQLRRGKMTKFQRRSHLSLLYNSGDRTLPAIYRPLTILSL